MSLAQNSVGLISVQVYDHILQNNHSVLSICKVMKAVFLFEALRSPDFTLSSFHTSSNAFFHCLTPSQTKGKKKGMMGGLGVWLKCSFLCAFIPFLLCTAPNAFFTSYRNLLHSYSQKKLVLYVCDLVRQSLWCRDGEGGCVWVPHNNIHQPN